MGYGMAGGRTPRGATGMTFGQNATGMNAKQKVPSGYRSGQLQQFTPEQMQLFQQLFSNVGPESFLSKLAGGDQSGFEEMEAPALRQFNALQGNIASRFSGMGGGGRQQSLGGRRSSGFQNTMNQASSDFAQDLQSQRQSLQRQAIMDLMGISNTLLGQRPNPQYLVPKQQRESSGWGGVAGAALGGLGGFALGGPAGAFMGAQIGQAAGSPLF